jgi:fructose-1-phosphate kinase PfkB-like protein
MAEDYTYEDILNKDILELMGVGNLPEEKKRELYTKMLETIQNRTIARIFDQLSPEDGEKLKQLLDSDNKTEIESFLKSKGVEIAKMMLEEAIIYKAELVGLRSQNA